MTKPTGIEAFRKINQPDMIAGSDEAVGKICTDGLARDSITRVPMGS
jgi:hypothetical protein